MLGKPIVTVTSVDALPTEVSISLAVPTILKSSVANATSPVPLSASTVKVVLIVWEPAAVNLPCWSTVKVGIYVY